MGDALNRVVNKTTPQPVFTFVDDFFGSGTKAESAESQRVVHDSVNGVLGPEETLVKKNVFAQSAEILGILVDYTNGTVRSKDRAIEKMFHLHDQHRHHGTSTNAILTMHILYTKPVCAHDARNDTFRYAHNSHDPSKPEDNGNPQRTVCVRSVARGYSSRFNADPVVRYPDWSVPSGHCRYAARLYHI